MLLPPAPRIHLQRDVATLNTCLPVRCKACKPNRLRTLCQQKKGKADTDLEKPDPGLALKAVWIGAEQFGNILGMSKKTEAEPSVAATPPVTKLSREEAIAMVKSDYEVNYFVSGKGDMAAYASNCLFADPFAGFNGTERFKKNVSNLGGLLEDIKLEITDWKETDDSLITSWRFSAILSLPWRPILAAAGATTHVFDQDSGKVVKHIEEWRTEPTRVLRQLLKPSARVPTNQWEVLFSALYAGDPKGVWFALSGTVLKAGGVLGAVDLVDRAITGKGLPVLVEALAASAVMGGVVTGVIKFAQGMQGGDTGTGGRF